MREESASFKPGREGCETGMLRCSSVTMPCTDELFLTGIGTAFKRGDDVTK